MKATMTGHATARIQEQIAAGTAADRTGGFCRRCGREHWLGTGNTRLFGRHLMHRLDRLGTIDLCPARPGTATALATAPLFGPERGKMFGLMECAAPGGKTVILYAFSGQYNGVWLVDGWVPPLFEVDDFFTLTADTERTIKRLGREIELHPPQSNDWLTLRAERRMLSRKLMHDIHSLYRLTNFRGETASLKQAFAGGNGIPTGTGDCCAPKLINFAAANGLRPLGLSEFFWGRENRSGGHRHGAFAASCTEKCRPILGFMLCGLDDGPAVD
jgi:hypothetical protein